MADPGRGAVVRVATADWALDGNRQARTLHPRAPRGGRHGLSIAVAIYGGYFGAGIGILMLSALALMGLDDIHRMNAVKTLLGGVINGTAASCSSPREM